MPAYNATMKAINENKEREHKVIAPGRKVSGKGEQTFSLGEFRAGKGTPPLKPVYKIYRVFSRSLIHPFYLQHITENTAITDTYRPLGMKRKEIHT